MMEKTLVILKPCTLQRGLLVRLLISLNVKDYGWPA